MHIAYQTPLFQNIRLPRAPVRSDDTGVLFGKTYENLLGVGSTINRDSPKGLLVRGAIRSSLWGDSPRGVGRFAPPATSSGQPFATRLTSSAPPRSTTGQSTLRCPAQREITNAANGSGQRARRRRHISQPPQAIPASPITHVDGSGTPTGLASRKPMLSISNDGPDESLPEDDK